MKDLPKPAAVPSGVTTVSPAANSAFHHSRSFLFILLLVVAWGLFAWWAVAQADREMRVSLLQQARIVAQAVSRDQVLALTGTAADLGHPDYQRLKEQFTDVRLTIPQCRYLYLLGRQTDGTVFVFVDSESATAKDYSPPGQVYAEVPAGFRRGFDSSVAAVEGPVRDRGAVWVSAVVPLMHPRKGSVLAVLVVEMDARDWKWMLANRTVLPVGRVLVLLMGGATYLFALRRPSASRNLMSALSLLAAGLLVTGMSVHYARANAESDALREFELAGNEIRRDILARLHAGAQILRRGAALFDASETVAREEWRAFTQGLQLEEDLPGIQGLGYASLIPRAQLAAHVAEIRRQGFPDYQVWPVGDRETYSAVIYLEPFTNRNLRAFGYDMLTEPVRRAALERARDAHAPTLTEKVRLVQEDGQNVQAGALMYVPVYRRGWAVETVAQRRAALQGWVYSPYRMADLVQGTLRGWELRFNTWQIDFQVYDGEVVSAATLLYANRSAETKALAAASETDRRMPIYFGGHSWTLRFAQPKGLVAMTDYGSAWFALFGGTGVSLFLFGVTLSLLSKRAMAQRMTERLTQDLRRMTERHGLATRAGGVGIWDYDVVNNRLIWDDQMFVLYGITRDQFCSTYEAWQTGLHPEDRQRGDEEIRMALRGEKEFNTEFRVVWPDGTTRTLRALATVRRDTSGQPTQMVGTHWDISERKHAEAALQESEFRYRTLFERAREGIFYLSSDGTIAFVNEAFARMHGYSVEEMQRINLKELDTPPCAALAPERMRRLLAGEAMTFEVMHYHKDGHVFPLEVSGSRITIDEKSFILCFHRDVTERKQAEAEKARREELNRRLQKSESLGRMAKGIAHHFNNRLQAVMLDLEVAKSHRQSDGEPVKGVIEAMQATRKAAELSSMMLTYLGLSQAKREPLDLSDVCLGSLSLWRATMPQSVIVEPKLPAPGPVINAAGNQIQQILTNLMTNAWESSADRRNVIRLTVTTATAADIPATHRFPLDFRPQEKAYACLEVADAGGGIVTEEIKNLFEPFYTTKTVGRGMGLAVVLGIAQSHNGVVTVENHPGQGCIFRVFFPVSLEAAPSEPVREVPTCEPVRRGATVLVVDDDEDLRETFALTLEVFDFTVLKAEDGVAALELFRRHRDEIGCVLCDVVMPRMNGWETLTALRRLAPGLPVILLSGYSEVEAKAGHHPEQPQAFLRKPCEVQTLIDAISHLMSHRKM